MPYTAACFLIGAIAISGLPPLNGFLSEFLIYLGSLRGAITMGADVAVPLIAAVAGLALIGGLAAACFTKAFGIVFLGEPRSRDAADAHESRPLMVAPMLLLAAGCIAVGFLGFFIVPAMTGVVSGIFGFDAGRELILREAIWALLRSDQLFCCCLWRASLCFAAFCCRAGRLEAPSPGTAVMQHRPPACNTAHRPLHNP